MDKSFWRYCLRLGPSVFAGAGLLLAVINGVLAQTNRVIQVDVNARAQYINQSVQLSNLEQGIARAVATAAVNNKDTKLGELLERNGIHYQFTPNSAAAAAPSAGASPPPPGAAGAAPPKPTGAR
ncbi:MAG TPA: hypothetical protein VNH44_03800 [Micropepsaceae bacterium]|nr:hypothetical protein [Micropepsaceae bacterium]